MSFLRCRVHAQWCADKVSQKFFAIKQYLGIQLRLQWNIDTTKGQGTEALPTKLSCSYNSISNIDNTKGDLYTECKYGGSLRRPGSSCAKARLVRPREFCFDCASQRFSRSIWFPSSCYVLKSHQKGDLTPAETKVDYLRFAKVLYEERNGFKRFGGANGGTYHGVKRTKVCSLHFRREE